jgi:mannose-6-phosphate isomerase-like protein (cupin superfamily)
MEMKRRRFLALGAGMSIASVTDAVAGLAQVPAATKAKAAAERNPVLVRAGMSRRADGSEGPHPFQDTLVRSFDSDGKLVALVLPVNNYEHNLYQGAPLHFHHENDEWIYIWEGEFVAEVGGVRYRLKRGDSLLMPKQIPHRWSIAGLPQAGAIHLYTPAGKMDLAFDDPAKRDTPMTEVERKAEFEGFGMTLLGPPLTKQEIEAV